MKFRTLFPLLSLVVLSGVNAQKPGVQQDSKSTTEQKKKTGKPTSLHRSKPLPPKAQVIEEEDEAGVPQAHPGQESPQKSMLVKPKTSLGEMPPLSELTPLTPEVKKPVNEGI